MNPSSTFDNEEKWINEVYQGNKMIELSLKVFLVGTILAVLLIASNIYVGLKIGFIQGGSLIAAVLGFSIIKAFRGKLSILENNNIQTMASAGATLGILISAIPALIMLGFNYKWHELLLWVFLVNMLGVIFAIPLRKQFIVIENLTFPSGTACASTIQAMHAKDSKSIGKAKWLGITGLFSGIFTWFRDGIPSFIPGVTMFPGKIGSNSLSGMLIGINWSPMLVGIGFLVGHRIGISLLLGSIIGWVVLGPILANVHVIEGTGFGAIRAWTMWTAIALMVASGITSLFLRAGTILNAFKSMKKVKLSKSSELEFSLNAWLIIFLSATILTTILMQLVFNIPIWMTLVAIIISYLLSTVSIRIYGETDLNPVGAMGYGTQIIYSGISPGNMATNIMAAGVTASGANESADMMQDFKTGYLLGATPKKQTYAQFAGVAVGTIAAIPIFFTIINAYGLGSENLPAPSAVTWSGMAKFLSQGFSALPSLAYIGIIAGIVIGILLSILEKTKIKRFTPSPFGIGIAMFFPGYYTIPIFLGSIVKLILEKIFPNWMDSYETSVASGFIVGESIIGVIVAILLVSGII
jgi:putative OPT family oligopeptide transporter